MELISKSKKNPRLFRLPWYQPCIAEIVNMYVEAMKNEVIE